jgi:hypothetical protein
MKRQSILAAQLIYIVATLSTMRREKNLWIPSQGSMESAATGLDLLSKTSRMLVFYSTYSPPLQALSITRY